MSNESSPVFSFAREEFQNLHVKMTKKCKVPGLNCTEELKLYRCLEEERGKWEVREGRLIEQMELIKGAHKPGTHSDSTRLGAGARDS